MHQPPTPNINIEDTSASATTPTPNPLHSPRANNTRPRSTASSELYEEQPWRQPSIRIRRLPSTSSVTRARAASVATPGFFDGPHVTGRPTSAAGSDGGAGQFLTPGAGAAPGRARSSSGSNHYLRHENRSLASEGLAPPTRRNRASSDPPYMRREPTAEGAGHMPSLEEGVAATPLPGLARPPNVVLQTPDGEQSAGNEGLGIGRRLSNAAGQTYSRFFPTLGTIKTAPADSREEDEEEEQYESEMVDVLDTVDPEISTLNTLTNVQNSLFVPDLGRLLNRRPTYTLTRHATDRTYAAAPLPITEEERAEEEAEVAAEAQRLEVQRTYTIASITSHLDDSHFAVLPHGETLHGWTAEDRAELNDHVRHLMHSRKEKFKRSMKGFGQYVRKPLGFFVTLYATLITLFGLAWVLFLIGWINVGGRKDYIVNVIDNVLVALFAIIGDGLAPFRAVDTFHMCFIAHYHHLTWRLRREQALPKLQNRNDLPGLGPSWDQQPVDTDAELGTTENEKKAPEYSVLSPAQQKKLVHHQKKFSRSHTFYKPHETNTHFAFPLRLLVAIVVLLDCHSLLQIALGTCTWAISYHHRPFALTTVILCCSITCNITAGIIISVGDHKTRKKDVLERMFRQELTAQAMNKLEKKKEKERQHGDLSVVPSEDVSTTQLTESKTGGLDTAKIEQSEGSILQPEISDAR